MIAREPRTRLINATRTPPLIWFYYLSVLLLGTSVSLAATSQAQIKPSITWKASPRFKSLYTPSPISPNRFACPLTGQKMVQFKVVKTVYMVAPAFPKQEGELSDLSRQLKTLQRSGRSSKLIATLRKRIEKLKATLTKQWGTYCNTSVGSTPTPASSPPPASPPTIVPTTSPVASSVPTIPALPTTGSSTPAAPTPLATPTSPPGSTPPPANTPPASSASLERYTEKATRYDLFTLVNKALNGPDYSSCGTRPLTEWAYDFCTLEKYFNVNGLEKTVDLVLTWNPPSPDELSIEKYMVTTNRGAPASYVNPAQAQAATLLRATGRNPFYARYWLFLFGLWTVSGEQWRDGAYADLHYFYYDFLYELTKDPALNVRAALPRAMNHPAMMMALNRDGSVRTVQANGIFLSKANENFPREFWELYTIGTNRITEEAMPDGTCKLGEENYTDTVKSGLESDIGRAAQIWSGWRVIPPPLGVVPSPGYLVDFNPANGPFQSEVLFEGKAWEKTVSTPQEVIDATLNHPNASLYLAQELLKEFLNQKPPCALVHQVAASIRKNDFKLKPVLRELFLSKAFYHQNNKYKSIKSQIDMTVAVMRLLGLNVYNAQAGVYAQNPSQVFDNMANQFPGLQLVQPVQFPRNGVFYYEPLSAFHGYGSVYKFYEFIAWTTAAFHMYPDTYRKNGTIAAPGWLVQEGASSSAALLQFLERVGVKIEEVSPDTLATMLFYLENKRNADGTYTRIFQPFVGQTLQSLDVLRLYWAIFTSMPQFRTR